MSSRDLTLCVLLLYCTVLSCRAQYQLFSQNCSRITSTGVTEYLICAEGTISLAATRDRFNISVTPSDSECGATPQDYCTQVSDHKLYMHTLRSKGAKWHLLWFFGLSLYWHPQTVQQRTLLGGSFERNTCKEPSMT